jgi:hypothetical protein
MADNELKINVNAESNILSPLIESENYISSTEKVRSSFLEIQAPETILMSAQNQPMVEAQTKISPNVEDKSSIIERDKNLLLAQRTEKLQNLVDQNLIPTVNKISEDITNKMNNQPNSKELSEQRPTFTLTNLVFNDRLSKITNAPIWV